MADRYRDYERERDERRAEAWRERDERWRGRSEDRPFSERASDEVRSWFGDDEARRRREMDEQRDPRERESWRERAERNWEDAGRYTGPHGDYGWSRPGYGSSYDRDREPGRWASGRDMNRERDFGRTDRYANIDEGTTYGSRWRPEARPPAYAREGSYRGTSGYEAARSSADWHIGPYTGRGPRGYRRSDERIHEEVCERLTRHGRIDASEIDIRVRDGEVTLTGSVDDREAKRLAEDLAESVSGVRDVSNQIKVVRPDLQPVGTFGRSDERTGQGGPGGTRGVAGTANTPELTPTKET